MPSTAMGTTVPCSCGLLPCICVGSADEAIHHGDAVFLPVDSMASAASAMPEPAGSSLSRLRQLVSADATMQCSGCMFLPCICPPDDGRGGEPDDDATSFEGTSPLATDSAMPSAATEANDTGEYSDSLGRVRLSPAKPPSGLQAPLTEKGGSPEQEIWVARELKRQLRPHQVEGVRFMYEHAVANRGCILADYMGLGKTLQVITVVYAYTTDQRLAERTRHRSGDAQPTAPTRPPTTLVLCPAICIPNWEAEFKKWLNVESQAFCPVVPFDALAGKGNNAARLRVLQRWQQDGGVLLMGYEMFRSLLNPTATAPLDREASMQVCTRVSTSTMEVTNSVSARTTKMARDFYRLLCDPGADLVVLDEGHRMKDPTSLLCQSVAKVATKRRLVLTGYPVQNSLSEYWCMVNFARENFVGSYDSFRARYERPIMEGDAARSQELIVKLKEVVLRRGKALLNKQLPPKREWILYCKLSPLQHRLYCDFLDSYTDNALPGRATADLLTAYSALLQVMNHPDIIHLKLAPNENMDDEEDASVSLSSVVAGAHSDGWGWESEEKVEERRMLAAEQSKKRRQKISDRQRSYEWARRTILGDGIPDSNSGSQSPRRRKLPRTLASSASVRTKGAASGATMADEYRTMVLENSGKMAVLMGIIEESFALGDKVVVFSQSVPTLKVISDFLLASAFNPTQTTDSQAKKVPGTPMTTNRRKFADRAPRRDPAGILRKKSCTTKSKGSKADCGSQGPSGSRTGSASSKWFLQIDGSTLGAKRMEYIQTFSSPTSAVKLLLVSTRAGAEGINLHAANRLVLFDVSWNPSNDHQSMCRSHRIGQSKTVHVYRLVSTGTMERMIYEQQVKKVDLSTSVVDNDEERPPPPESVTTTASSNSTSELMVPFSGFLQHPGDYEHGDTLELDEKLLNDDKVLTNCVKNLGHWLVGIHAAHEADDPATFGSSTSS